MNVNCWIYLPAKESHPDWRGVTDTQFANRMLLREIMTAHGFKPIDEEWWHFTLKDEPYPDTYFDFPVKRHSQLAMPKVKASDNQFIRMAEIKVHPEWLDACLSAARTVGAESVAKEDGVVCIFPMQRKAHDNPHCRNREYNPRTRKF